jgi:hypothetical protein
LEERVEAGIAARDVLQLDALITNRHFSSRDSEWINEFPDTQAVNVLSFLSRRSM